MQLKACTFVGGCFLDGLEYVGVCVALADISPLVTHAFLVLNLAHAFFS